MIKVENEDLSPVNLHHNVVRPDKPNVQVRVGDVGRAGLGWVGLGSV